MNPLHTRFVAERAIKVRFIFNPFIPTGWMHREPASTIAQELGVDKGFPLFKILAQTDKTGRARGLGWIKFRK
jgi:hypothetical protein